MESKVTDKLFQDGLNASVEDNQAPPVKKPMSKERRELLISLAVAGFEVDLSGI